MVDKFLRILNSIVTLSVALLGILLAKAVLVWYMGLPDMLGFIPDDAFYYLKLAQNFLTLGVWTFDGIEPASGFHLFHAYVLLALLGAIPSAEFTTLFAVLATIHAILICLSMVITVNGVRKSFPSVPALVPALPFFLPLGLAQGVTLMETPYVLLFGALALRCVLDESFLKDRPTVLIAIGLTGSLCRTDFGGLLAAPILICLFCSGKFDNCSRRRIAQLTLGALIGIGVVYLHHFQLLGSFGQYSAKVKFFWSALLGHSYFPALGLFWETLGVSIPKVPQQLFLLGGLILVARFVFSKIDGKQLYSTKFAILVSTGGIVFYIFFYSFNSQAIQIWYASYFILLSPYLFSLVTTFLVKNSPIADSAWRQYGILLVAVLWISFANRSLLLPQWPHATTMFAAAKLVAEKNDVPRVGSWNAGIIGYFSGKIVTNLDGLVNDNAAKATLKGDLMSYLSRNHIEWVLDFDQVINSPSSQAKSGFKAEDFKNQYFERLRVKGEKWGEGSMTLYKRVNIPSGSTLPPPPP
jgi:hypothetical protein